MKEAYNFSKNIKENLPAEYKKNLDEIIILMEDDLDENDGTDFFNLVDIIKDLNELINIVNKTDTKLASQLNDNILKKINNIVPDCCSQCNECNKAKPMHRDEDGYWICHKCYIESKNDTISEDNNNSYESYSKEDYYDMLKSKFNQLPCDIISSIAPSLKKNISWIEDYLNNLSNTIIIPFSFSSKNDNFSNPLGINFDLSNNNIPVVKSIDKKLLNSLSDNKKLVKSYNKIIGLVFNEFTDNNSNRYYVPTYTNDSNMTASEKLDWLINWMVQQPQPLSLKFSADKNKCSKMQIENLQKIIDNIKKNISLSLEDKLHLLWKYSDCAWILDPENPSDNKKRTKFKKCILNVLKKKFYDQDNSKKIKMDPYTNRVDDAVEKLILASNAPITSQNIFMDKVFENIENIIKEMIPKVQHKSLSKKKNDKEKLKKAIDNLFDGNNKLTNTKKKKNK